MVLDYFGLREAPFGVTPDPRYLYLSRTHREALATLMYGVSVGRGFMGLVAKPGMGKTTLLFQILEHFQRSARTVFLFQTLSSPRDFLRSLLADLGVDCDDGDVVRMHSKLNEALLREAHSGRQFIVVIDEAQNLEDPVLEVVRMLSNFETSRNKLMQIILAGQPQLAEKLRSHNLVQLRQRISLLCHLDPFDTAETNLYIDHRLCLAGHDFRAPLFTRQARQLIASGSEGIPRNINNICFNALSLGCALERKTIDRDVIVEVLNDLDLAQLAPGRAPATNHETGARRDTLQLTSGGKRTSTGLGWIPKFAILGVLSATLGWSVAHTFKNLPQWRHLLGSVSAEAAATGLPVRLTADAPSQPLGSSTQSRPAAISSGVRTGIKEPDHTGAGPTGTDSSSSVSASASSSRRPRVIRVKSYEKLFRICAGYYGRCNTEIMDKIFVLNPSLINPDSLQPGQELRLPPIPAGMIEGGRPTQRNTTSDKAGKP